MRINVQHSPGTYEHDETPHGVAGWYDSDSVQLTVTEGDDWNGHNRIGRCSGLQLGRETLTLTASGRWVLYHDGSHEFNGPEFRTFLSDAEAQAWLIKSDDHDDVLAEHFPDMPEEHGPGRPVVVGGKPVNVRLGDLLQSRVDQWADDHDVSRAEAIRQLTERALQAIDQDAEVKA